MTIYWILAVSTALVTTIVATYIISASLSISHPRWMRRLVAVEVACLGLVLFAFGYHADGSLSKLVLLSGGALFVCFAPAMRYVSYPGDAADQLDPNTPP